MLVSLKLFPHNSDFQVRDLLSMSKEAVQRHWFQAFLQPWNQPQHCALDVGSVRLSAWRVEFLIRLRTHCCLYSRFFCPIIRASANCRLRHSTACHDEISSFSYKADSGKYGVSQNTPSPLWGICSTTSKFVSHVVLWSQCHLMFTNEGFKNTIMRIQTKPQGRPDTYSSWPISVQTWWTHAQK